MWSRRSVLPYQMLLRLHGLNCEMGLKNTYCSVMGWIRESGRGRGRGGLKFGHPASIMIRFR